MFRICSSSTSWGSCPLALVVCQYHRSWRFWSCRRSHRKSLSDSAGDKVVDMLVIVQRQVLGETAEICVGSTVAFSGSSSSWTRLLTRPLVCNVRRVVQIGQKTVEFLQLQLSDGFVPGHPGSFRAFDDEEFLRHRGLRGGGADAGSFTPKC